MRLQLLAHSAQAVGAAAFACNDRHPIRASHALVPAGQNPYLGTPRAAPFKWGQYSTLADMIRSNSMQVGPLICDAMHFSVASSRPTTSSPHLPGPHACLPHSSLVTLLFPTAACPHALL